VRYLFVVLKVKESKAAMSTPQRHIAIREIKLHTFLTSEMDEVSYQLSVTVTLGPVKSRAANRSSYLLTYSMVQSPS